MKKIRLSPRPARRWPWFTTWPPPKSTHSQLQHHNNVSRRFSHTTTSGLFGQPTHETHPHLLAPGELTPGITALEYHNRRGRLLSHLPPHSAVLLPSAALQYRSGAVFHRFRQETAFLYLTGFSEPESHALITKTGPGSGDFIFHLWCRPKNPGHEQWLGPWSGLDAARDVWNADEAGDIARLEAGLGAALQGVKTIYTDAELTKRGVPTSTGLLLTSAAPRASTLPLKAVLNPLRAVKSPAEIACMRRAGKESGLALTQAMRQPWRYEQQLAAFLEHEYHQRRLDGPAYIPVVSSGPRNLLIHYVLNNDRVAPDDLILVDGGGEYGSYIADITRTWPANGRFTEAQHDLYRAVLNVQEAVVVMCRADADTTLDRLHAATEDLLREELRQLGFDLGRDGLGVLFPHHVGHYIGLDVHDVPGYSRGLPLVEGHAITVEPGVYVPDEARWPRQFRGMGIRIEDSVVVGKTEALVLTEEAVKRVRDIHELRNV